MRKRLLPYKMGSQSAKSLARELNILRVQRDPALSKYRCRRPSLIINWGSSTVPSHLSSNCTWVNHPSAVAIASNKKLALDHLTLSNVPCPEHTDDSALVREWLEQGHTVFARTLLSSHSGRGIKIIDPTEDYTSLPYAPLYTKYIKKHKEYRVHVLPDNSIHVVEKRRRLDVLEEDIDWRVRNHGNGWIFAQGLSYKPDDIENLARTAVASVGLDFGALDIVYNSHQNKSYVIEINTSPALVGRTLEIYKEAFKRRLGV